jgi:hypothetical protein
MLTDYVPFSVLENYFASIDLTECFLYPLGSGNEYILVVYQFDDSAILEKAAAFSLQQGMQLMRESVAP